MVDMRDDVVLKQSLYAAERGASTRHGLTIDEAFIRGIRHIGYRSNLHAFAELIDNSIQAYAQRVDLVFGYAKGGSAKKPDRIAVIDDGHGIPAAMMRLAMMWGGTHREDDREGLGRYGYGLPCAAVSIGRRFTVISKLENGPILQTCLDLDELEKGAYRTQTGHILLPEASPAQLPDFIEEHVNRNYPLGWQSGTVILLEKLDRVEWTTALGMRSNLLRHLSVTYHKILELTALYVDDTRVRAVDPLFLTPSADHFALDDDRAIALEPVAITIRNPRTNREGIVELRYAWLPPTFGALDKQRDAVGLNANERFSFLKDYHGLVFSRNGRLIDVHTRLPWTVFINNDRYIRVEIEFSAVLDELFGVTTSKQQVSVSDQIWDALRQAGMHKAIEQLRSKVKEAKLNRPRIIPAELQREPTSRSPMMQAPTGAGRRNSSVSSVAERSPSLLVRNPDGGLRANSSHPLFDGSAGAAACGQALKKLVDMLAGHSSSTGARTDYEYGDLLARWSKSAWPD
ncbi:ATP-binding protein [Rhizobium sp. Leaf383]|uniref:ATP-binding protein n=1 Tax=Rhizobium sp. Leaf383 TaxID=1736357 RepID=UPI000712F6E7|nr:ATP-binding protein [Rhizobium sp. Leaf383]KQS82597.1 hypothetical protein ASG58_04390 [Rhizobium sp. Leaf383]